jgi:phosphate transport system substrate-binding protein
MLLVIGSVAGLPWYIIMAMRKNLLWLCSLLILATLTPVQAQALLSGEGASFPKLLYEKLFSEYEKLTKLKVDYLSTGSGGGQKAILGQTADFGASDVPLTDEQLKNTPGNNPILHIPIAMGAVVPIYNVPGIKNQLRFDGITLANIYLGKIKNWNDPAIKRLNPAVNMPNLEITVVFRSGISGTTAIWVDFLSKSSSLWKRKLSDGLEATVEWPLGLGLPQNADVAEQVKALPGAIGYVEVIYAKKNNIGYGLVKNKAGKFIDAGNFKAVSAAARGEFIPADTRVSLTDTDNPDGYPIAGFTWVMVYENQKYGTRTEAQAKALTDLLQWMIEDSGGQQYHEALGYAQIPDSAQARAKALVARLRFGGKLLR